ncbi:hypothetical protein [Streptomyces griseoluteus]|uniref:hypothetical protein n=1 Tax=Streptomyces griseoluteus TaxID=29306 RepID=UPI00381DCFF5
MRATTVSVTAIHRDVLDPAAGMDHFLWVAAYESMIFTIGKNSIPLGPCIEVVTVDKVLNLAEARRQMEHEGQAEIRMRLDRNHPPLLCNGIRAASRYKWWKVCGCCEGCL